MSDRKEQVIDILVLMMLCISACAIGKVVSNAHESLIAFYGSAFAVIGLGEWIWELIRKWAHKYGDA